MQLTIKLLIPGLLLLIATARAAEPAPAVRPEQLKSPAWWRQQAVHYAGGIADADAKGRAHSELVYAQAFAGEFDGARASTESINNPQLRIYAHVFLAKQYKKKGDDDACRSELQQAEKMTLTPGNTSHSDVIRTYLELGQPAEAISLAAEIPDASHRKCAFKEIAAKLAKQGKLEMAYDVVKQRLPASSEQSGWSVMANACADKLRIDEAQTLASRLTDEKLQDRVYDHLVKALVKADRAAEAGPFADRISDARLQAIARAKIVAKSAKKQSIEVLQSRIEKVTTREEKLALYDLLFAKLVDAGDVAAAERAIDSMVKTIEGFPQKAQISTFGVSDDAAALAIARSNYLAIAKLLAKKGDREGSLLRIARARKATTELSDETGLGKMMLVAVLVKSEIDMGEFDGARASLAKLGKGFIRSSMAAEVAAGLIKSGDVKSGLEVAELITWPIGEGSAIRNVGKGSAIGNVASALLRAGELEAAKTLLRNVGDGRDEVEAFKAVGQTMAELGRRTELHQWLGEQPSNIACAYLCMGAARVDELHLARAWLAALKNERTDISEALSFLSSEFNFDGRLLTEAADIRRQLLRLREVLRDPSVKTGDFQRLDKSQIAKYMTNSEHLQKYQSSREKIKSMVLFNLTTASPPTGSKDFDSVFIGFDFNLTTASPPTGSKDVDDVFLGFDSNMKIVSWFDH